MRWFQLDNSGDLNYYVLEWHKIQLTRIIDIVETYIETFF